MELVGIVRCPVTLLLPYGDGRQVDPDVVRRLAKCFDKTECKRDEEDNFICGIVTYNDLRLILSALGTSEKALKHTILRKDYPLLSGQPIACLDGRHRIRAAVRHKPLSWWTVKLLCVRGTWIEFPLKVALSTVDHQLIQDKIEATSRETSYSDAEIYRLLRKYSKKRDTTRFKERLNRLSAPKQISVKGFLKREQLVRGLDALLKFPGIVAGLQFGNVHKHLALHIDENISKYFVHILRVWEFITNDDHRINAAVDIETVRCLQFRAPITSFGDRVAINRMFEEGTLFEGLKDLGLREQIRERVLSVQIIIPSIETFHENMKYISIGAKILRKYVMDTPVTAQGEPNRHKLTLFESLASCWSAETRNIEVNDGKTVTISGAPSAWLAYKSLFIAALRNFAQLSSDHPRQDVRGETLAAVAETSHITSLAQLAQAVGFTNNKTKDNLAESHGHPAINRFYDRAGRPADWRGGIPFTKSYCQLRLQAFHPQLDSAVLKGDEVGALFVFRDTVNAFFEEWVDVKYQGHINPLCLDLWGSDRSCDIPAAAPSPESNCNSQGTVMADDNGGQEVGTSVAGRRTRPSVTNALTSRSTRIGKHNREKKPLGERKTMKRKKGLSPNSVPEAQQSTQVEATSDELMVDRISAEVLESSGLNEPVIPGYTIVRQDIRRPPPYDLKEQLPIKVTENTEYTIERRDHRDPRPLHDLEIFPSESELGAGPSVHQEEDITRNERTITRQGHRSPAIISPEVGNTVEIGTVNQTPIRLESQADLIFSENSECDIEVDTRQTIRGQVQRTPPPMENAGKEARNGQASNTTSPESAGYAANITEPETLPQRPVQRVLDPRRTNGLPTFSFQPSSKERQPNPFIEEREERRKEARKEREQQEAGKEREQQEADKKRKRETANTDDTHASISIRPIRGMQPQVLKRRRVPNHYTVVD
jgi:hypothetical protein